MLTCSRIWSYWKRSAWLPITLLVVGMLGMSILSASASIVTTYYRARHERYQAQTSSAVVRPTAQTWQQQDRTKPEVTKAYPSWEAYTKYATAAQNAKLDFWYSFTTSKPMLTETSVSAVTGGDQTQASQTASASQAQDFGNVTLTALYDDRAFSALEYGTYKVVDGKPLLFRADSTTQVLVSQAFAEHNHLKVGDKITLHKPGQQGAQNSANAKAYTFTIHGIVGYNEATSPNPVDHNSHTLAKDLRDNHLYVTYAAFTSQELDNPQGTGWDKNELNIMLALTNPEDYAKFSKLVAKDLPAGYEVRSPSLQAYERQIRGLQQWNTRVQWLPWVSAIATALIALIAGLVHHMKRRSQLKHDYLLGSSKPALTWQLFLQVLLPLGFGSAIGVVAGLVGTHYALAHLASGAPALQGTALHHLIGWSTLSVVVISLVCSFALVGVNAHTVLASSDDAD